MRVIFGSAGFAKEIDWLLHTIYGAKSIHCFVGRDHVDEIINGAPVWSDEAFQNWMLTHQSAVEGYVAVGSPAIREKIVSQMRHHASLSFPTLIAPGALMDQREGKVTLGEGTFVCEGNILTTDITIGKFVHLNLGCTVGHDTRIGDFVTLSPGCHISGNVTIGNNVFFGTGASVLERLHICDSAVIGAGSVVTKDITEPGTYVGIPAKRIK